MLCPGRLKDQAFAMAFFFGSDFLHSICLKEALWWFLFLLLFFCFSPLCRDVFDLFHCAVFLFFRTEVHSSSVRLLSGLLQVVVVRMSAHPLLAGRVLNAIGHLWMISKQQHLMHT